VGQAASPDLCRSAAGCSTFLVDEIGQE